MERKIDRYSESTGEGMRTSVEAIEEGGCVGVRGGGGEWGLMERGLKG